MRAQAQRLLSNIRACNPFECKRSGGRRKGTFNLGHLAGLLLMFSAGADTFFARTANSWHGVT
jgi:hypothetical protein